MTPAHDRITRFAALLTVAAFIVGCGGGGGGGGAGNLDGSVDIARFESPESVVADAEGNRYVADTKNHVIRKISADGTTVTTFAGRIGEAGDTDAFGAEARFSSPEGLAIDGLFLYVDGTVGRNGTARFNSPVAVAVGPASLGAPLFVADRVAHAIRMVIGGTVSTIAGTLNAQKLSSRAASSAR